MVTVPAYMYATIITAEHASQNIVMHIMTQACTNPWPMLVQIDAGAEVVITQPPLLWNRFEAWMDKVQQ